MNERNPKPTPPASAPAGSSATEPAGTRKGPSLDPETTLDLMKALEGAAIVLEPPPAAVPPPEPEPSYNPYDRGPAKPGRKRQS